MPNISLNRWHRKSRLKWLLPNFCCCCCCCFLQKQIQQVWICLSVITWKSGGKRKTVRTTKANIFPCSIIGTAFGLLREITFKIETKSKSNVKVQSATLNGQIYFKCDNFLVVPTRVFCRQKVSQSFHSQECQKSKLKKKHKFHFVNY